MPQSTRAASFKRLLGSPRNAPAREPPGADENDWQPRPQHILIPNGLDSEIASSAQRRTNLGETHGSGLKLAPHPEAIQREPSDANQRNGPPRPGTNRCETLHRTSMGLPNS